ncbi:MAG: sulfite exporter TauE/SafE family protein [Pseudomonadota bacterium]|nr:sulfite exporter TauE/SafE family protein [Pseudomonadota bacterium]
MTILILLILGLGVGLTSSFLGAGGGVLVVPLLPYIKDISLRSVIATAQATVLFIVLFNTISFRRNVKVSLKLTLILSIGTALGAFFAARMNLVSHERTLAKATIALLSFLSLLMVLQASGILKKKLPATGIPGTSRILLFTLIAVVAGASGGFTGIGVGLILTSLLTLLPSVNPSHVVPIANACMLFSTIASVAVFSATPGLVQWSVALTIFAGATLTAYWGSGRQHLIAPHKRQYMLSLVLITIAFEIFRRYF